MYRQYFNIDPEYFPQATEELINSGKVDWKKFYPHETFVKFINDTIRILTRQQKLSLWVEGAYGTGKSHSVLTLQKLLDSSEEETKAYFDNYDFLSKDLYNKLQGVKNQGKILTVRRYGSSSVNSDTDLIFCIQESIVEALRKNGIKNLGSDTLKDSIIDWLKIDSNKIYFNTIVSNEKYANIFKGEDAESLCKKLQEYSEDNVMEIMDMILKASDDLPRNAFKIDMDKLVRWIKEIISKNNLKAIFFIWDEFTEYFQNNYRHFTEFQKLIEISETNPFYLCIVTHKSVALFNDNDDDRTKILSRFVSPTCNIELPENMAFRLIGQAMEKTDDTDIRAVWDEASDDLNNRMHDCRKQVMECANVTEKELVDILPLHPYAALILKHISSAFDSDQRSMFDFIKNDRGEEIKGFQWFIDNYDPEDDDPLLTIDLLWDFFYEKGKENLVPSIRTILDSYHRQNVNLLTNDEKKVLKTVLILQAISQKVGDSVEVFISNIKNVNYAYEGSELENGRAGQIAEKLCKDQILFKKPMGSGKFQFSAMTTSGDSVAIEKKKEEIKANKKTRDFVNEAEIGNVLGLSTALGLRFIIEFVTVDDFKRKINEFRNKENKLGNKMLIVLTFAKDDGEAATLSKQIKEAIADETYKMIFVDTSSTTLGIKNLDEYFENMANSIYQRGKDNAQADKYNELAIETLKRWKDRIYDGEFYLYSSNNFEGLRLSNIENLKLELNKINTSKYPNAIEVMNVVDSMYNDNFLSKGAECGVKQELTGTFNSGNVNTKLNNNLDGAWKVEKYWLNIDTTFKYPCIKRIKLKVNDIIEDNFEKNGQVSISQIYNCLKFETFGFLPCNLSAFVLGFILKEFADDLYRWTDGQTSDVMSVIKLKEMIYDVIKQQSSPSNKYRDKYIVTMTQEQKSFSEITSKVFNISENECTSVQQTRDRIRNEMKKLLFPMWCLKYVIEDIEVINEKKVICKIIDEYSGIANTGNANGVKTETDLAQSIGRLNIENKDLSSDLIKLVNKENCKKGMRKYISGFNEGKLLKLAQSIGNKNLILIDLRNKFDADAANWVWNSETTDQKIDELIDDYEIINESNKITSKSRNFDGMAQAWCDKLGIIKLSYDAIKSLCDDIKPLLEILYAIKKYGVIQNSQKETFLSLLKLKQDSLKEFFSNQIILFKEACEFQLFGLDDEEIDQVYHSMRDGMFTLDKSEFVLIVENCVENYKKTQEKRKLKDLWKNMSGANTPREWSENKRTPILCMVPLDKSIEAKKVFDTINRSNSNKSEIKVALEYLNNAHYLRKLNDQNLQDEYFKKFIIKNYFVMLSQVNEVRDYLEERVTSDPYDWFESAEVDKALRSFAEEKYIKEGSLRALNIIEEMDEATVKKYLKELIKENVTVGMEIIKDNK